jgi:cell division protein FtsN
MKKYVFTTLIALLALSACKDKAKEKQQVEPPKVEQASKDTTQATASPTVAGPVKPAPEDKYFLIAGSFLEPQNANTYESRLKKEGYDAKVVQRKWGANNQYYRVACQSFHDRTTAYNTLAKMQQSQEIQDVWLLVK